MSALPNGAGSQTIPSGTITFVFTDIEGSTQRWDRYGAAMERALRRHDALIRAAIETHRGYVFKTIGDAFCATFTRAQDAIAATCEAQRALGAEDFSAVDGLAVRIAIHTGTADERERDYFGPTVNRVARLLGIAHGGQIVVSGATSDLVQRSLPPQTALRDLGEHRLKDLARPERVYQVLGPDLRADFPRLRSLGTLPNNLPSEVKSFVGRETEIAEIAKLIGKHRLVTIVGSGGIGKTRTSLHVAANLLDGSGDGVWFVELAPLSQGELIPATIAAAVGCTLDADADALGALADSLETKRALLVLDNCEHLVESAARVVATLLRTCPNISVVASSRQSLGIDGEMTYRMPSLRVPHEADIAAMKAADIDRYAAIALFVERARAADRRFEITDENVPIVADICRRLDGIALAIELAASRITILSPRQLRERLDGRFTILSGGGRDLLPRQRTLHALIDWSHDLLDVRERTVFRRLGIFASGFTLEGASAVAGADELDAIETFDVVASLVDKSLVSAEPHGDVLRYRLLESTRAYALDALQKAGERDLVARRQVRELRDRFARMNERHDATARSGEAAEAFAAELDNVRYALDGAIARGEVIAGAELLAELGIAWRAGFKREGCARNETFIAALPSAETRLLAKLSTTRAALLDGLGAFGDALEAATVACAHARRSGDGPTLGFALLWYAYVSTQLGRFSEAEAALDQVAAIPSLFVRMRLALSEARGLLFLRTGDLDGSARCYEEALREHTALGNLPMIRAGTVNLAELEFKRGEVARAIELARDVLPAMRTNADQDLYAACLTNLAGYRVALGDLARAAADGREALAILERDPHHYLCTFAIEHLALVDALEDRFARATRLAAYVDAALERHGAARDFTEQTTSDRLKKLLDRHVPRDERARLAAEGAALTPSAAVALARVEHPV